MAIRSSGELSPVEYRNLTWEHLGTEAAAPLIVITNESITGELTTAVVEQAAPERRSVYVPAHDDVEKFVCGTVATATESVVAGAEDDFFDLGADSLAMIEISTSIFEQYGVRLDMQEVFEAGNPAQLSRLIRARLAQ
ncbi:acyl carrier protein [Streptomyces sp. NPDC046862]|uniref:acyl carrier protein n=1 Tax=Streptomyces sp. NPDC046862 TaxID=3154603 RepID=UPI0034534F95